MAQFDVHRNSGRNRSAIPYVVVAQTSRLDGLQSRLVIPLVVSSPGSEREPRLAPVLTVEGRKVVLHPWEMQAVPSKALGHWVASLADDESSGQIIQAIDEVITRAYG